jgi:uncharacterized protein YlxW (UPF0749 family)
MCYIQETTTHSLPPLGLEPATFGTLAFLSDRIAQPCDHLLLLLLLLWLLLLLLLLFSFIITVQELNQARSNSDRELAEAKQLHNQLSQRQDQLDAQQASVKQIEDHIAQVNHYSAQVQITVHR